MPTYVFVVLIAMVQTQKDGHLLQGGKNAAEGTSVSPIEDATLLADSLLGEDPAHLARLVVVVRRFEGDGAEYDEFCAEPGLDLVHEPRGVADIAHASVAQLHLLELSEQGLEGREHAPCWGQQPGADHAAWHCWQDDGGDQLWRGLQRPTPTSLRSRE